MGWGGGGKKPSTNVVQHVLTIRREGKGHLKVKVLEREGRHWLEIRNDKMWQGKMMSSYVGIPLDEVPELARALAGIDPDSIVSDAIPKIAEQVKKQSDGGQGRDLLAHPPWYK